MSWDDTTGKQDGIKHKGSLREPHMLIVMFGDEGEIAQPQPTLQIMQSIACNHANARVLPVIF